MHSADHLFFSGVSTWESQRIDKQGIQICSGERKMAADTTQACTLKCDQGCWSINGSPCAAKPDTHAVCAVVLLAP